MRIKKVNRDIWIPRCEICGQERPDEKIDITTYFLKSWLGAKRILKHCNDNKECLAGAIKKAVTGE